jgi:hypothetical protein
MTTETIYVSLLKEGTKVWRPVQAMSLGNNVYKIISSNKDYEDEEWQFTIGDIVLGEDHGFDDGTTGIIAKTKI